LALKIALFLHGKIFGSFFRPFLSDFSRQKMVDFGGLHGKKGCMHGKFFKKGAEKTT
jgi:hypothetical protein